MGNGKGKKTDVKKAQERLEEKKKQQKKTLYMGVAGVLVLLVIAAGYILLNGGQGANDPALYNKTGTDSGGQNVVIPLSDITGMDFHFYTYDSGGVGIKYFIVKDASGDIHTAFDACDVCYEARKGYRQSENFAKCNNCGQTFAIDDIGTKNTIGGCWPGYLPHTIEGNNIVIKSTDLEAGKYRFE